MKSKEELLDDLKLFIETFERIPSSSDFNSDILMSRSTYNHYFGGIGEAIKLIGYEPNKKSISIKLTNEEIKQIYKDFFDDLGHILSFDACKNFYKLPSPRTVLRRLNCNWNDFVKQLGYKPNRKLNNCMKANDGSSCLSSIECAVHNYLLSLNIQNLDKETLYKYILDSEILQEEAGFKRLDWAFDYNGQTYYVELFGMMDKENYRKRHDDKISLMTRDNKLDNFIAIYPKDLSKLDEIFSFVK